MRRICSLLLFLNFSIFLQAHDDMAWLPSEEPLEWAVPLPHLDDDNFFEEITLLADLNDSIESLDKQLRNLQKKINKKLRLQERKARGDEVNKDQEASLSTLDSDLELLDEIYSEIGDLLFERRSVMPVRDRQSLLTCYNRINAKIYELHHSHCPFERAEIPFLQRIAASTIYEGPTHYFLFKQVKAEQARREAKQFECELFGDLLIL